MVAQAQRESVLARCGAIELFECAYPPNAYLPVHRHDITNVSLVLRGQLIEQTEAGAVQAGPGCVVVKPAGTEHADRIGPQGATLFALRMDPRCHRLSIPALGYAWRSQRDLTRLMLVLFAESRGIDAATLPRRLQDVSAVAVGAEMGSPAARISSVQSRLHDPLTPVSSVGDLAAQGGFHRVYLARAFREHFGASPSEYGRRSRITQAAFELAKTDAPAALIAARFGFADHAHFCRCFAAQVGLTPGAFRRTARAA